MKKILAVAVLLLVPALASAQLPEPIEGFANPVVVGGVNYLTDKPVDGSNQARFFLTANLPGFKPFSGAPLYFLGVGVDIRTLPGLGEVAGVSGAGLSVPVVTYAFYGSQAVVQVGYSRAFGEEGAQASGVYAGLGFSLTSPNSIKAKRIAKAKAKAAKKSADASQGPPAPIS